MLLIVEGYRVGYKDHIVAGTKDDRVILYNEETVEQLLKSESFRINDSVELLSGKRVSFDLFQLEQFEEIGIQL